MSFGFGAPVPGTVHCCWPPLLDHHVSLDRSRPPIGLDQTMTSDDPIPPPTTPQWSDERSSVPRHLLRRSQDDRVIGGVAAGIGRYLGVDSTLVRVAFVLLAVFGGSGLLIYLVAWLVIPDERPGEPLDADRRSNVSGAVVIGGLLVAAGFLMLLDQVIPEFRSILGPLLLIAFGVLVLVGVRR